MALDNQGCKNLVNAIYARAAADYIKALICNDKESQKTIGDFLVSGAYYRNPGEGEYLKKKSLEETNICRKLISEFIGSDLQQISIDEKLISIPVLMIIIHTRYKNKMKLEMEKQRYILRKKAIKNGLNVH